MKRAGSSLGMLGLAASMSLAHWPSGMGRERSDPHVGETEKQRRERADAAMKAAEEKRQRRAERNRRIAARQKIN